MRLLLWSITHLTKRGHWPATLDYDGHLLCGACDTGRRSAVFA